MFFLNIPWYRESKLAPQMHTGSADFLPDGNESGHSALLAPDTTQQVAATLPTDAWGAGWATAPDPGVGGTNVEHIAIWGGLPETLPSEASQLRVPAAFRVKERSQGGFGTGGEQDFKDAVAALQDEMNQDIACFSATGTRYADLQTNFTDGSQDCETRDILRESDNTKLGEAFIFRLSANSTAQHWVLRSDERFDQVRVIKRTSGGYSSLSAFLSAQAAAKPSGVAWPHAVETCVHYFSCPW